MADIGLVQQAGSTSTGAAPVRSYVSNVTAGNLLIVTCSRYNPGTASDPLVVGNLAKTAGTATIGTIALDVENEKIGASDTSELAVWSVPCTGTGSLTFTITTGAEGGTICHVNLSEWANVCTVKRSASSSNGVTSTTPDSGNITGSGKELFLGVTAYLTAADQSLTEDGAFTLMSEDEATSVSIGAGVMYRITTSSTTDSASWTIGANADQWSAGLVSYLAKDQAISGAGQLALASNASLSGTASIDGGAQLALVSAGSLVMTALLTGNLQLVLSAASSLTLNTLLTGVAQLVLNGLAVLTGGTSDGTGYKYDRDKCHDAIAKKKRRRWRR